MGGPNRRKKQKSGFAAPFAPRDMLGILVNGTWNAPTPLTYVDGVKSHAVKDGWPQQNPTEPTEPINAPPLGVTLRALISLCYHG